MHNRTNENNQSVTKRMFSRFMIFLAMLLLLISAGSTAVMAADGLEVHFLDVGQGDCTLIRQGDHAMLIDAGREEDKDTILNYLLNTEGITSLDYVVGTHPHEDHIGSLDSVIESLNVGEVLLPDVITTTRTFEQVLTAIDSKGLGITVPVPGTSYPLGDASFSVFAPVGDYGDDLNNWSIALKVTYGESDFLFTGDAEASAEQDIVSAGFDLSADVFQAGHHGSDTSNSNLMLDSVNPAFIVISCGSGNSYGHPNQEALDRFWNHGAKIFRTDAQGTIVASSDGTSISWSTEPSENWAPGGASFSVTTRTAGSSGNISYSGSDSSGTSGNDSYAGSDDSSGISGDDSPADNGQAASSEIQVHITETGSKYHSAGCQYLRSSDIIVTLDDAKARGLTPCSKCNPPQ